MSSAVGTFICAARNFIEQGFRGLPTILAGTTLVLGLTQGNVNFLFFFIGLAIMTPTLNLLLNILLEFIFVRLHKYIPQDVWIAQDATAIQCRMFPFFKSDQPPEPFSVVPSFWLSMMAFFYSYMFVNALSLYQRQGDSKAAPELKAARKNQALISMVLICALLIVTFIVRYSTGCEKGLGVFFSLLLGGWGGYGWYKFMVNCGLGRLDDLFGIANRMLPYQSLQDTDPTVCVPG
jgi:hypothetical protein